MPYYNALAGDSATAAADTAVVLTLAAGLSVQRFLKAITATYSATPTGGLLTVESPSGTVIRRYPVTTTERTVEFPGDGLLFPQNQAVVVRLAAGGAGIIGYLNITQGVAGRPI